MRRFGVLMGVILVAGSAFASGTNATQGAGQGAGSGYGNGYGRGQGRQAEGTDLVALLAELPESAVSAQEIEGLQLMREEEKLARDVYAALYEVWNLQIFQSISRSESQHMDSLGLLLDRYDLDDPVGEDIAGEFENQELQALYDSLVEAGSGSISDALTVGATVEDLDIFDLQREIANSDSEDIQVVYQNLMKGSRNHIRSFVSQLERLGETYDPQYISSEYYARIFAIARETAPISDPNYVL